MQDADDLANGAIKSKFCCDDFKEAYNNDTFQNVYGNEYESIKTRIGMLPIPKVVGYEIILIKQYDFHEGYGETRQIAFCPFCGAKL